MNALEMCIFIDNATLKTLQEQHAILKEAANDPRRPHSIRPLYRRMAALLNKEIKRY
jgi:hypothetical protein